MPIFVGAKGSSWQVSIDSRFDARSGKAPRYQYRVKGGAEVFLSNNWSVNGFMATGSGFGSSYNLIRTDADHDIALRRLFLRHQDDNSKTELGVIPPFKGRVSSTGLSKDGWLTGVRHVRDVAKKGKIEIVAGTLSEYEKPGIQHIEMDRGYFELEYSSFLADKWAYEVSFERMLDDSFLRTEVRYQWSENKTLALELVDKLSDNKPKVVLSLEGETQGDYWFDEYFLYYAYVNPEFGIRAELIEDFVDVGHALSFEIKSKITAVSGLKWFSKMEIYEGQSRFQLGLSLKR